MIASTGNELVIHICDPSPSERKQWLIQAIAAAVRWNGQVSHSEQYTNDGDNLIVLAQLLEAIVETEC